MWKPEHTGRILFMMLPALLFQAAHAQTLQERTTGLRTFSLVHLDDTIHYCVSVEKIDSQKPVLLFLDGSGAAPLLRYVTDDKGENTFQQSFPIDIKKLAKEYHVVMISKPGLPFLDTLRIDDIRNYRFRIEAPPAAYTQKLSLQWRAEAADAVLHHILTTLRTDRKRIIVFGYSEGAQVAPKVAVMNKDITHCIAFVGSGINQLYSFIIEVREQAECGAITHEEAQQQIDQLYLHFDSIYRDPTNTKKEWNGHSYLRWSSFCGEQPMENMLKLDIPIYLAQGSNDHNGQILSYDYVKLEFMRRGKKNLTYKVYPGCDHFFNREVSTNGKKKIVNVLDEAVNEALRSMAIQLKK